MNLILTLTLVALAARFGSCQVFVQPEQIHISYGNTNDVRVVTWVTINATKSSIVEYGPDMSLAMSVVGNQSVFIDGGSMHRQIYIHRAAIPVKPKQRYFYHVGSPLEAWSGVFSFVTTPSDANWSPRMAVYGDLGNVNAKSMAFLQGEVQRGNYDMVLHVGDMAYDMDSNNAQVGDEFMRMLEPIAAYVPYMTCPGNHEQAYNFSNYVNRFSMPGQSNGLFYSFDLGSAHFIGISTEFYFYINYGWQQIETQWNWLVQDLAKANKPENRKVRPWIITFGHRPMYCTNDDRDDCTKSESVTRTGLPLLHICALEPLFRENGVDFSLWAHEHSYERLWPTYDRKVYNGSQAEPYTNPGATVHVTTGSAGCQENHDGFVNPPQVWTAFRNNDYGFSTMTIHNATHIHWTQFSVDKAQTVDDIWIKKTKGPYPSFYQEVSRLGKASWPYLKDSPICNIVPAKH